MTIGCLGITVLDQVFRVPTLPTHGGKFVAHSYFEVGGGPAATAAVAISKLGAKSEFIGRVGYDGVAETMTKELNRHGVGTQHIARIPESKSSFSAVLVDDEGERMIINYQDGTLSSSPDWLESIDFSKFSTLLCDVRWREGALHALHQARKHNIPSVLDADMTPEDISELVKLADHVVFSQPGLMKLSGESDPTKGLHKASQITSGVVYVTLGRDGCMWLENGKIRHASAFAIDVVDTTGAGDVFHGAFALAVAEHQATEDAIRFASAVAALKCTQLGGRDGIPDRQQVINFLNNQ